MSKGSRAKAIKENYVQVKDRIKQFRDEHPEWGLHSEILGIDKDECLMKGWITNETGRTLAVGHSRERTSDNPDVNITSLVENCETSAWGRCLANLGYGIDKAIASHEEMRKVKASNTSGEYTGTVKQKATLQRLLRSNQITSQDLAKKIHDSLIKQKISDDVISINKFISEKNYELGST